MSKDMDTIKLEKVIKVRDEYYNYEKIYTQIDENDKAYLYERKMGEETSYYVILKKKTRTLEVYHEGDKVIRRYSPYREIFPDSFAVRYGDERCFWWYERLDNAYAKLREL